MAKYRDAEEIYRESLQQLSPAIEPHAPRFERVEVWPYPDLDKLWVRLETSPFIAFPNLAFAVYGPDGEVSSSMFMVEIREPYQSVTMHLRQAPRAGETYRLEIELARDEEVLDTRIIPFDLVYRDPKAAREEATDERTE